MILDAWRRRRRARRAPAGPLRDHLATAPRPDHWLAVDVETTGLDPATDALLAVGFVPIDGDRVVLSGARRLIVRAGVEVGWSATIHGITDDHLAAGEELRPVLDELFTALRGRTMVCHHARMEEGFLGAAALAAYGVRPVFTTVDTLAEERRRWERRGEESPRGTMRLMACRERYGLPVVPLHDALGDAVACAELHLAQRAHAG